jgi:hypothetical protein
MGDENFMTDWDFPWSVESVWASPMLTVSAGS